MFIILALCFVGSTVDGIAAFKLSSLLPADTTRFYRYSGSLTTPDCYESVAWTVFADVIQISSAQVSFPVLLFVLLMQLFQ